MHLVLDVQRDLTGDDSRHAEQVMRDLGITYQHATPQSMYDCWIFWNCKNVPEVLPRYLRVLDIDPIKAIGNGLSPEDALKIIAGESS